MRFIVDFHIHSHRSIATSKKLIPEYLDYWAQLKGIDVVGTGDAAHPGWLEELKEKIEPVGNGLFRLKDGHKLKEPQVFLPKNLRRDVYFILTAEISNIYKKNGKVRKVHNLCVFPDFESVEKLQRRLEKIGNITSDGRPILGMDSKNLLEIVLETNDKSFLVPAHIWTPWFSVLGAKSGFDTVEECYEDLTQYIFAVETGLSSDPPMNWACKFLDKFRLISNSDAHSPEKLGREANLFDTELSYDGIYNALKYDNGFIGTVEFFPQEGKYHYDGHRKCEVCFDPLETIKHNGICPVCRKPVTKGVMYRVAELADRSDINEFGGRKEFYSITSLPDLISEIMGKRSVAQAVKNEYFKILGNVGSDFHTLLFADLAEIEAGGGQILAEGIKRLRAGSVHIQDGFDGEFGRIKVFEGDEINHIKHRSLFSEEPKYEASINKKERSISFNIEEFQKEYKKAGIAQEEMEEPALFVRSRELNEEYKKGPCMVIAGPGAGKTSMLVSTIESLVNNNLSQDNILAITFSNKASLEIKERLMKKIPNLSVNVSTFHALGLAILKKCYDVFGRKDQFDIIDDVDKEAILFSICPKKDISKNIKKISLYKQGVLEDIDIRDIFDEYNEKLKTLNAFDLDDLIYLSTKLLVSDEKILNEYRTRYLYVFIDEYQDINARQYEFITTLVGESSPNLFVIGDPDQAIYGFRGSDVRYIDKLLQDYPDIKTIRLGRSYRCPTSILKMASQALDKDEHLEGNSEIIKTKISGCETERSEADFIATQIEKMIGGVRSFSMHTGLSDGTEHQGISSLSDFAVLCRTTAMFDPITSAMHSHGIPYQVVNTDSFYMKLPFKMLLKMFKDVYYNKSKNEELENFIKEGKDICDILKFLVREEDLTDSWRNRFINLGTNFSNDYTAFFQSLALRIGIDDLDIKREAVSIMTLHASKGLEFKAVFIPGCEEGIIPFELFGKKTEEEVEEEKRLFYVGVTRTKQDLFLTYTKKRILRGRLLELKKSSILNKLEKDLLSTHQRTPRKKNSQLEFWGH